MLRNQSLEDAAGTHASDELESWRAWAQQAQRGSELYVAGRGDSNPR
jgi:hypothetical protein